MRQPGLVLLLGEGPHVGFLLGGLLLDPFHVRLQLPRVLFDFLLRNDVALHVAQSTAHLHIVLVDLRELALPVGVALLHLRR